jgi:signal transduction histidine kinase
MLSEQRFTILLVDDRPENLISLEEILQAENRTFLKAESGNEALKLLLKNPQVGLILLDVQMPEMDGFEVARLLKLNPKTKDVSIIFVTAISKEEQYVLKGFSEGAVDYLHKPLDINVTRAKVKVFEQLCHSQQELKETAVKLQQVNKQLERFTYSISHDLKSPLASLIMLLDISVKHEDIENNAELKMQLDMACQVGHQLSEMISSILDYSRQSLDQQTIEEVDTHELVNQLGFLLAQQKNVHITAKDDLPVLRTTKAKLQQVFQNLISNAIKYNDKNTTQIEIGANDKDDFYEFYVKDNGPGIARADNQRIFKLFETASNKTGVDSSTGVGLNMLKLLIEEQGGKIWVDSKEGEGSTFYFLWRK